MDKYLIEILKEINTIIIPDLGALTIVNAATNEVMFMPYLKYDDGKLAQYIAEKEDWSENDAKNLIAKYVREINTKLDQGESYDMYNFGSFYKNEEGDLEFKSWEFDPLKEAIDTPPVFDIPETKEEIIENDVERTPEATEEAVESDSIENIPEIEVENIESTIQETLSENSEKSNVLEEIQEEKQPQQMISEEEQWADDLDVPPVNYQKEVKKQPILEKTQKDKKRKKKKKNEEKHGNGGVYAFFIISALVIAGAIFLYLNQDKYFSKTTIAKHQPEEHVDNSEMKDEVPQQLNNEETNPSETESSKETEVQTEQNLNEPEEEEIVEEKSVPVKVEEPKNNVITTSSGITIDKSLAIQVIAGSFSEESNAASKVASLKASGFDAAIIGRYNGLFFVSIGSFNSMNEFNQNKQSINAVTSNYWVFKK